MTDPRTRKQRLSPKQIANAAAQDKLTGPTKREEREVDPIPVGLSALDLPLPIGHADTLVLPPDLYTTWLNHILRMSDNAPGQVIVRPAQAAPRERDHFFEVQHIVTLVMLDANWQKRPLGEYIDLALMVNDNRNLYQIEKQRNQAKKSIPFNTYYNNRAIGEYLQFALQVGKVVDTVKLLILDMRNRQSEYNALTRSIAVQVFAIMRW